MNATRTNSYLRHLPLVLGVAFVAAIGEFARSWTTFSLPTNAPASLPDLLVQVLHMLVGALPEAVVFWVLGQHFGRQTAGMVGAAMALVLAAIAMPMMRLGLNEMPLGYLALRIAMSLPFVVWGFLMLDSRDQRSAWGLLALGMSGLIIFNGYQVFYSFDWLSIQVTRADGGILRASPVVQLSSIVWSVVSFVLLAEWYRWAEQGRTWRDFFRRLDLTHRYSAWEALVVFVAFRAAIFFGAIGLAGGINLLGTQDEQLTQYAFYSWPVMGSTVLAGSLLYLFILANYRKFLLEYFLQCGKVPSYFYWFLQVPFLGVLLFSFGLAVLESRPQPTAYATWQRSHHDQYSYATYIRSFLMIGQILSILSGAFLARTHITNLPMVVSLFLLIHGLILITYMYSRQVFEWYYWVMLGMCIASVFVAGEQANAGRFAGAVTFVTLVSPAFRFLISFGSFFALSGVLHIDEFEVDRSDDVPADDTDAIIDSFAPDH
jgi:hypothetical protein